MAIAKKLGLEVYDDIAELIELPAGLGLPSECVVVVTYPERARVEMVVELRAGRYEVKGLSVLRDARAAEITAEFLRSLTPRDDVRAALLDLLKPMTWSQSGAVVTAQIPGRPPKGIASQGPTEEVLKWVAQEYALAYALTIPPTKAVQESLGVSRATAGRWVAEARHRGLIGTDESDE
jgi:hypothetical protein